MIEVQDDKQNLNSKDCNALVIYSCYVVWCEKVVLIFKTFSSLEIFLRTNLFS